MALIGYVRCSTNRQMVLQQIDALRDAGCLHIYKDKAVRATAKKRPGLMAVRKALKSGDTFVITSIDRAFRSTIDCHYIFGRYNEGWRHIQFSDSEYRYENS